MPFDNVIVSTDDSHFYQYVPIVAAAWKKFFPAVKLHIAFVTDRKEDNSLVVRMKQHGIVHLFPTIEGIPTCNHAKLARLILAGRFTNAVCMVEDVDTIPLQREFYFDRTSRRKKDHLLLVGCEVYDEGCRGQAPMSTITAEGHIFKAILNPSNLSDVELLKSWESAHELPFSDEELLRELIAEWKCPKIMRVDRAVDIFKDWVDRSWWSIDEHKLNAGGYTTCNFLRPFLDHYASIEPVVLYIYQAFLSREEVVLL